ncbi:hypothetical protein [Streptomyces sp. NPDC001100]
MELKRTLVRAAMSRPGVLLVVCPGATRERLAVEAELVRRRWPCAAVPADADLLVVAGEPGAEDNGWVASVWDGIPAPKARIRVTDAEEASDALDRGLLELEGGGLPAAHGESDGQQGHRGHEEVGEHSAHEGHDGHGSGGEHTAHHEHGDGTPHPGHHGSPAQEAHDHGGEHSPPVSEDMEQHGHHDHAEHSEHGDGGPEGHGAHEDQDQDAPKDDAGHEHHTEHGGHEAHDGHDSHNMHGGHHGHAGHGMGVVDGLPMAERADDRDGLRLDRLHVPLGPALADWPAGLVLRVSLQGDIVQEATVERSAPPPSPQLPFWNEPFLRAAAGERVSQGEAARRLCAAHLDSLGRFFAVAGWSDMAARARHVRDRALAGASATELSAVVRPLVRRAERSRTLRWLTAGLGPLPVEQARRQGVTGPALVADGDAHNRMLVWLDAVGRSAAAADDSGALDTSQAVGPRGRVFGSAPPSRALLDVLPGLLEGAEFACARIIVASLDPDLDELLPVSVTGMVHG